LFEFYHLVDSHVGKHIFDEVLSSKTGLLHDKTRVLVTNSLFVLPNVDLIVVLKDGKVSDIGTYDNLMAQKGEFADLINQYSSNKNDEPIEEVEAERLLEARKRTSTSISIHKNETKTKLVENEKAETGEVKLIVYKKFAKSMSLFWTLLIIINYTAYNAASSYSSFWLSAWTSDTDHSRQRSGYRLGIYALIGGSQAVFVCIGWISIVSGTLLASSTLHQRLLEKIMHAPMYFFDTTPLGRILNRFSKDIDILDTIIQLTMR
jgi:ABC-type multidrug transport system fused ATPase/permease subunit